jgi:hypothetical protein
VAMPKEPIKPDIETAQAHVRALLDCYSSDKPLLQQAIKDLERRILYKKQQIEIEKEVLKKLHERLANWDNCSE